VVFETFLAVRQIPSIAMESPALAAQVIGLDTVKYNAPFLNSAFFTLPVVEMIPVNILCIELERLELFGADT